MTEPAQKQFQAHKNAQIDNKKRIKVFDDRGTRAWADVPNATEWVEELRGNDTPEETPEVTPEVPCKTDPRAPHGFDRNASHSADRYVCECESWEPPKRDSSSWVGLTVKEVLELLPSSKWKAEETLLFVQRIEDELKEKNT